MLMKIEQLCSNIIEIISKTKKKFCSNKFLIDDIFLLFIFTLKTQIQMTFMRIDHLKKKTVKIRLKFIWLKIDPVLSNSSQKQFQNSPKVTEGTQKFYFTFVC